MLHPKIMEIMMWADIQLGQLKVQRKAIKNMEVQRSTSVESNSIIIIVFVIIIYLKF
jgi:hypothetical protein